MTQVGPSKSWADPYGKCWNLKVERDERDMRKPSVWEEVDGGSLPIIPHSGPPLGEQYNKK